MLVKKQEAPLFSPKKVFYMKEKYKKASNKGMESRNLSMVIRIWVLSKKVSFTAKESTNGKMEVSTKGNFLKVKGKEKESSHQRTEISSKDSISRI